VPIIVRGDGCYLEDAHGKRYLDALAGLFSVNIGYGYGEEMGEAAAAQMRELPFYTNWSYAHPRAIELASEIASLAPGDLNRLFFVSGGSEAVESAWKLARQYYTARGEMRFRAARVPGQRVEAVVDFDAMEALQQSSRRRWKAISHHIAYHGTTMGALSINGIPAIREPFEPLVPGVHHVRNTNRYHRPPEESVAEFVERRLGREFLDRAVDALVGGIYAGDPQKLSVSQAFPKLCALEKEYGSLIKGQVFGARKRKRSGEVAKPHARKFSFDEGLQVLTETLCAKLKGEVRMRCPVTALTKSDKAWNVRWRSHGNEGQTPHSAIVYAGTAFGLSKIEIETRVPVNVSSFADIHYPPVASVVLGFRREDVAHPLDGFGMLIPRLEGFRILGSIFSSSLFPNRAPAGHVTLTSYVGGTRSPELAHERAEELCHIVYEDLRVLLGIRGKPTFKHHVLFPKAIPQYELGYGQFRNLMAETEIGAPGLFLAGHYRDGISVSDCIVAGKQVAERIKKYLVDVPVERGTRPIEPHARVAA